MNKGLGCSIYSVEINDDFFLLIKCGNYQFCSDLSGNILIARERADFIQHLNFNHMKRGFLMLIFLFLSLFASSKTAFNADSNT